LATTHLGFCSEKKTLVEGNMEEVPLPSLFEQARQIHSTASESSVDQVPLVVIFYYCCVVLVISADFRSHVPFAPKKKEYEGGYKMFCA
jgi:hypothetical protein